MIQNDGKHSKCIPKSGSAEWKPMRDHSYAYVLTQKVGGGGSGGGGGGGNGGVLSGGGNYRARNILAISKLVFQ